MQKESDRLDIMHKLTTVLFDGELHFATINEEPKRILDIGTGTGIWAIDIGRCRPNSINVPDP